MSGPLAIEAHGVGKRYRIGSREAVRDTLIGTVLGAMRRPLHNFRQLRALTHFEDGEEKNVLWALRDVDFQVEQGEVVGLIGRNGAGKSTLLKVLSRITTPTRGRIELRGRVASLLEVGTGFHPDLTGRENVYLNGTILGMTKREIDLRFDEIVAFSEVETYIDTPVKRYSSGMRVRLAFAVAAHLEPEILLIDEVLAVGDAAFRRKSLGKLGDVANAGRTVIFVSHNMAAISHICSRALLLENGRLVQEGDASEVVGAYLTRSSQGVATGWRSEEATQAPVRINDLDLLTLDGNPMGTLCTGDGLRLRIGYTIEEGTSLPSASFVVRLKTHAGLELLRFSNTPISGFPIDDLSGDGQIDLVVPALPFTGGLYSMDVGIAREGAGFYCEHLDVMTFEVVAFDVYGSGFAIEQNVCTNVTPHRWMHRRAGADERSSAWLGQRLTHLPEDAPA